MGRRPNALILQFFERGPKLTDNSNRYPHTCKACGENFPKGRIDSLTNHLTKRCPAISEGDRVRACLTIHGFTKVAEQNPKTLLLHDASSSTGAVGGRGVYAANKAAAGGAPSASDPVQQNRDWTALETLAEVSRHFDDLSEKHDDRGIPIPNASAAPPTAAVSLNATEIAPAADKDAARDTQMQDAPPEREPMPSAPAAAEGDAPKDDAGAEQRIHALLPTVLSVAAAATARLNPCLLDPRLREEIALAILPTSSGVAPASTDSHSGDEQHPVAPVAPMTSSPTQQPSWGNDEAAAAAAASTASTASANAKATAVAAAAAAAAVAVAAAAAAAAAGPAASTHDHLQAWTGVTPMDVASSPAHGQSPKPPLLSPPMLQRGGYRLSSPTSGKARHSRSRFDAHRRKEVQEVRKIGACIRCRILRKTCSKGHPCDACRKVLSPRVWKTGCVRTKFSEQLDLYSAGVQIVLAQHRINALKSAVKFTSQGAVLQVSIFPESNFHIVLEAYQSNAKPATADPDDTEDEAAAVAATLSKDGAEGAPVPEDPAIASSRAAWAKQDLMMIDYETEDVPNKVELYMRQVTHEFVEREKSRFARVTMDMAIRLGHETSDELLKKAIELWGLVEILDRERQWNILVSYRAPGAGIRGLPGIRDLAPVDGRPPPRWLKESTDQDTVTSVCLQLTAAAERKAAATSKALLTGMQRVLQDSKTKIDRNMFFTTLILLNCVEKTTWAFKAWEQASLQPMWPLEKPPGNFTQQGYVLADLLKMLLGIRKALPRTYCRESDGMLATSEDDPILQEYFQNLELKYAEVQAKQERPLFSPTDSRSLELLFCSTMLLPSAE